MNLLNKDTIFEAVFYADGGASPNPGFAGYGFHGYFFASKKDKNFIRCVKPVIYANHFMEFFNASSIKLDYVVLTDSGYKDYNQKDDSKFKDNLVTPLAYVDKCFSFFDPVTNNVAELTGALNVFQELIELKEITFSKVTIILDSQYVLQTLTKFGDAYSKNGWLKSDGVEPKNLELIKLLLEKRDCLKATGVEIVYEWCKGHSGNMGNGMADYQASVGVRRSKTLDNTTETTWSSPKKYWDPETDRHPFMFAKRSYFNRVKKHNNPGQYYLIEPASEELLIGKRDHEGYAVIRLKEPCKYMEAVIEAQGLFGQEENRVILGRMDRIYNRFVQKFIRLHGHYCLSPSDNKRSVNFLDHTPVAVEHNPPALIYRVSEAFQNLDERLEEFLKVTSGEDNANQFVDGLAVHDITKEFYLVEEKKVNKEIVFKQVLRQEITVGYKNHLVEIEEVKNGLTFKYKAALALSMDLPSRNCLKQLEDHLPKIYLITWSASPQTLQYACVVDCISGTGIWSNYFCDRVFIKT